MKKYLVFPALIGICLLFFYKTILFGKLPFPGDLLLTQYAPWRHVSYNGYVAGAIPSKDQYFDIIRELYPWKTLVVNQFKRGIFPLWNPYNFSGSPLLANYQSQVFYPIAIVYLIFSQPIAWTIITILQPLLGSLFMYLFATEIGLTSVAAILTAMLFNFSSFASVWMEFTTVWNTILWLPLLLFLIERGIKQKRLFFGQQLLFIAGLFCAITGGHPQDFINTFLFLILYTIIRIVTLRDWTNADKKSFFLSPLIFLFTIPFFLAAPQLFPTIELFRHSARVTHEYSLIIGKMLVQWWQLPLLAVQDFFGNPATKSNFTGDYVGKTLSVGIAGFFLAITAVSSRVKSWHKKFFMLIAFGVLLLTVRTPITELFYRYPIPIMSTGTPTRILFILALAVSILAGFGYDEISRRKTIPVKALIISWSFMIILWIFALIHPNLPDLDYTIGAFAIMKRAMLLTTIILGTVTILVIAGGYKKRILLAIIPLCIAELLYGFLKFNPFVPQSFIYPKNPLITYLQTYTGLDRFWGYGTAGIEANFATQEQIYSPDGTDPLNLSWYNQLTQSSRDGNLSLIFNRTTRSDAQLAPGYGEKDLPSNKFRLRLMDVLGVKYIIDRDENPKNQGTFPTDRFKEIWRKEAWTVYENLKAAPRAFATTDVRWYSSSTDFEKKFYASDFIPGSTVLLDSHDWNTLPRFNGEAGSVNIFSYQPNKVEIAVKTDSQQFLLLSDTYDGGWTSTVNNIPTRIFRSDYAFRGVLVPKGQSTVVFSYEPRSFQTGLVISVLSLLGAVSYFILNFKVKHKKK
jgi:hypothetical protein